MPPKRIRSPDASATQRGLVNTIAQAFSGLKTFLDGVVTSALSITGSSPLLIRGSWGAPGEVLTSGGKGRPPRWSTTSLLSSVVNVKDFGAVGDGNTDDWPAFKAAHDSFKPDGGDSWRGGVIHIPRGRYRFSQTWVITKRCIIEGEGCGYQSGNAATILVPDAGVTGIRLYSQEPASPDQGSAAFTVIRDLQIEAGGKTTIAHGIYSSTQVRLERLAVGDFTGNGIQIIANSAKDKSGNANQSYIGNCTSNSNAGHGFYIQGSDANVITVERCLGTHNGGWQFNNESWLGNYYSHCLAECGTGLGTYRSSGGGNVFRECYLEYGSNWPTSIHPRDMIIGCNFDETANAPRVEISGDGSGAEALVVGIGAGDGTGITTVLVTRQGSGYTRAAAEVVRGGGGGSGAGFTVLLGDDGQGKKKVVGVLADPVGSGFEYGAGAPSIAVGGAGTLRTNAMQMRQRTKGITRAVDLWLGGYGTNGAPLVSGSVADVDYHGAEPDRTDILAWNDSAKCFESQFNHSRSTSGIRYVHPLTATETGGRSGPLPAGSIEFPNGLWLGDGAHARFVSTGTAAPVAGEWNRGDRIYDINATAGGTEGWVCTASGTPGTWKTFGLVGA